MNKDRLITIFVKVLLEILSPDRVQRLLNNSLDHLEKIVLESKNEVDDIAVLPVIKMIRDIMNEG